MHSRLVPTPTGEGYRATGEHTPGEYIGGTLARRARAGHAPGIFCDPCPTGGLLPLICWATLYGFAPWPPGHQQMF